MLRIHKQRTRAFLIDALDANPNVDDIPDEWEDMIFVRMVGGDQLVIYLYDRGMDWDEVRHTFAENTRRGIHTLYILSAPMLLPEPGAPYAPENWMMSLITFYGGLIYCYRVMRTLVDIAPLYFIPAADERYRVQYGEKIDVNALRTYTIDLGLGVTYRVADFSGPPNPHWDELYVPHVTSAPPPPADAAPTPADANRDPILRPNFTATNPYHVLGLPDLSDRAAVKAAFRDLARRYHPDLDPTPGATDRMQTLNRAYRTLMSD